MRGDQVRRIIIGRPLEPLILLQPDSLCDRGGEPGGGGVYCGVRAQGAPGDVSNI